ncbi:MAG TPA: IS481 family transposase [Polyangiaceae bacterium]|jgi:transposase InsO family protein
MSQDDQDGVPARVRWARMRFSIIGQLLASPPEPGEVAGRIAELAATPWRHPTTGEVMHLSAKTIERMYYAVRGEADPIRALERKVPKHAGTHPRVSPELEEAITTQYREHPGWTYQLHYDNLRVVVNETPALGSLPAYATVRRFMKDRGLFRAKRPRRGKGGNQDVVPRETRSYEVPYVNGLWHYDFHEGRRQVLTPSGTRKTPSLFGLIDDCSRVCPHLQWYVDEECTETLVHGLCQGFQKRELPRGTYSDRGGAMRAAETVEGHERLSILQQLTLPKSPQQNAKMEYFWTQIEGRLMPMLEGVPELTLALLNTATQAWVEQEYHRSPHTELGGKTPLERYLEGPNVGRPSPSSEELRRAFRMEVSRTQRRSDGTTTVEGVRYEIPSAYRALRRLRLRVARWDLSSVDLVDARTGVHLATLLPLDKTKNADGLRRVLPEATSPPLPSPKPSGIAPLLRQLMAEYAATGLPPAYLPKDERPAPTEEDSP